MRVCCCLLRSNLHVGEKLIVPLAFPRCCTALMQLRLSRASLMHCGNSGNSQDNSVFYLQLSRSWSQADGFHPVTQYFSVRACLSYKTWHIMESLPWAWTYSCCSWKDCLLSMIKFNLVWKVNRIRWEIEMHTNIPFYFK